MAGFRNDSSGRQLMFADNVDFTGATIPSATMIADGNLLIGSSIAPNIKVGNLTSSDGSLTITNGHNTINLAVTGGAPYYSLSQYIVGGDNHSQYTTIQAGINAAVLAGASASAPLNVYIKPGTYAENLTVKDGVNLVAFSAVTQQRNIAFSNQCTVYVTGTVTHTSGTYSLIGIGFTKTTGGTYNMAGGTVYMTGCATNHSSNSFWNFTTTTTKIVNMQSCNFNGTSTATFATNTSASTIQFISENNNITYTTRSTIASNTVFAIQHNKDYFVGGYTFDCPFTLGFFGSEVISIGNTTICTSTANTSTATLAFENCAVQLGAAGVLFDLSLGTASGMQWYIVDSLVSTTGSWSYLEKASIQRTPSNYTSLQTGQTSQIVLGTINSGFRGSQQITMQGALQTTDATVTTIATITIPTGGTTTLRGNISGQKTDSTNACGGDFLICARNPAGTAILANTPITNVMSTSTATFSVAVTGATIIVQVTGIVATSYNWLATYTYQTISTNT